MSSILKALKKLEHDNATIKPGQMKIDSKILQERSTPGISRMAVSLVAVLFVGLGCGSTYLYMRNNGAVAKPEQMAASTTLNKTDASLQKKESSSGSSPGTSFTQQPLPQKSQQPARDKLDATTHQNIKQNLDSKETVPAGGPLRALKMTEEVPEKTPSASPLSTPQDHAIRPALVINGIAFQEGSSDNLAIINGISVAKGAVIEGVKVEEIRNDRVRFSHNGEKFEIVLNKSNR